MRGPRSGILVGMFCGVLLAGAIAMAGTASVPALVEPPLSAAELDSLAVYLAPSEPAPLLDEYGAFLPAAEPLGIPAAQPAEIAVGAIATPSAARNVSAIVTGGARPLAIVDDASVSVGSVLPDGARVVSIHVDHLVVREADGTLRTLRLKAG